MKNPECWVDYRLSETYTSYPSEVYLTVLSGAGNCQDACCTQAVGVPDEEAWGQELKVHEVAMSLPDLRMVSHCTGKLVYKPGY